MPRKSPVKPPAPVSSPLPMARQAQRVPGLTFITVTTKIRQGDLELNPALIIGMMNVSLDDPAEISERTCIFTAARDFYVSETIPEIKSKIERSYALVEVPIQ